MTDATRGLVRYEPEPRYIGSGEYVGDMAPDDSGDWVRYEDAERIAAERDVARVAAESLERLLDRERAEHSRAMSDAAVERIRPSCSEEGGSCHAMMHSMCRRMNAMERDAARIQRARARNLVERIRERAARLVAAVEGGCITRPQLMRRLRYDFEACMATELAYSDRLYCRADRIAAKYLGEGT